jgi:outer membrane protein insertion porin family
MRMSTGLELDVILPIVQAPFRVYYAVNPSTVREYLQPPILFDKSTFANNEQYLNAIATYGTAYPLFEKRGTFRFTIGRTF